MDSLYTPCMKNQFVRAYISMRDINCHAVITSFLCSLTVVFVDRLVICPAGVVWLNTLSTLVVMVCLERPLLPLIGNQGLRV